jgi:diaminohydroxyphosphoribosylaminopyrimidine deaminase/5-amino-6-(5-phosphoribosylamino)uracil reductase
MNKTESMKKCIALAKQGLGTTYPNPLVGAVILHKGKVIGSGWHQKAGGAHAEVHAINDVKEPSLLVESTLIVNLEPCSHHGKTPPCADLIIRSGIKHVVIGTQDPFEEVQGKGIQKLIDAGIRVEMDVEKEECLALNKRFFTFVKKKRPYIVLKWAESLDGYIAPIQKSETAPYWISQLPARKLVHKWRSEEQAILIGKNTALTDNPSLTTRLHKGPSPIRVLIDPKGKVNRCAKIFDNNQKTIVFTATRQPSVNQIEYIAVDFTKNAVKQICDVLYHKNIQSLLIEGGRITLQHFIDANLWDEARIITGKKTLITGVKSPNISSFTKKKGSYKLGEDLIDIWIND